MQRVLLVSALCALLSGCPIPTPRPATTEMVMDKEPTDWNAPDLAFAKALLNEQDGQP